LAMLYPWPVGAKRSPKVEALALTAGQGVRIEDEGKRSLVLFRQGDGELEADGVAADGAAAAYVEQTGGDTALLLAKGRRWAHASGIVVEADREVDALLTIGSEAAWGTITSSAS